MTIDNKEALDAQIQENKTNGKSLIVKFGAAWCGPCRALDPTLAQMEKDNENLTVASVDVDTQSDLSTEYGVRNIPSVFIYKNGEIINNFVGAKSATDINSLL